MMTKGLSVTSVTKLCIGILLVLSTSACASEIVQPKIHQFKATVLESRAPGALTDVVVQQVGDQSCSKGNIPVTFGQPFRKGDVPAGNTIQAFLDGQPVPTQTNIKARNKDGSARHAVITVQLPCDSVRDSSVRLALGVRPNAASVTKNDLKISDVLATEFGASIALDISGKTWTLDARRLLAAVQRAGGCDAAGKFCKPWLSGSLASAWIVGGPLVDSSGATHPHLAAYFAIRAYGSAPVTRVRVDVIVENAWTYLPKPHNFTYDATVAVGGKGVYAVNDLDHYRQARWHKIFWWGNLGVLYAALNSDYLQASKAVPQYQDVQPTQRMLTRVRQSCAPMQHCDQTAYMPTTGAQAAIGPLSRWTTVYVLDTSSRAYRWMLANADALGSYAVHYRLKQTGEPVSIPKHPCIRVNDSDQMGRCPAAGGAPVKQIPSCHGNCSTPLTADTSHHPVPAYVAYLVTGDWYYMSELAFWANWQIAKLNPKYRQYANGLISSNQIRGQAWALRTLGYAAYVLPQRSPIEKYLNQVVINNIRYYTDRYVNNPGANKLGFITNGYAVLYRDKTGIAPWQNAWMMWSVGNLVDLGFSDATRFRNWLAQFWIDLFTSRDFCWQLASKYSLKVRDSRASPYYRNVGQVYDKTFPRLEGFSCDSTEFQAYLKKATGNHYAGPRTMVGYPHSPTGFPANIQVGVAAAADSGLPGSRQAWATFSSRSPKPDYSHKPQFAVIPRSLPR